MTLIRRRNGIRGPATIGVQLIAITLCLSMLRSSASAAPGDIVTSPAPAIGADPPKGIKVEQGDAKVSPQTGALTYSYPIAVPPGRGSAVPSLSLQYTSQGGQYGGVAAGWTLGGLPEIRRDYSRGFESFDRPTEGGMQKAAKPRWVSTMAGGRELIQVGEPHGAEMLASFRAQADSSFTRYQQVSPGASVPYTWVALTTDGSRYEFGFDYGVGEFRSWAPLSRTVDAFGNEVKYSWEPIALGSQNLDYRVSEIAYSANANAGIVEHARVTFEYATDAFPCNNLPVGAELRMENGEKRWRGASRLDAIVTWIRDTRHSSWRIVRRVELGYDAEAQSCMAPHTPNRLLTSITERDGSGVQLRPEMSFSYGALERGFGGALKVDYEDGNIVPSESIGYGTRVTAGPVISSMLISRLIDLDADGRVDRLRGSGAPNDATCSVDWNKNQAGETNEVACLGVCDVKFTTPQTATSGGTGIPAMPWANAQGLGTGTLDTNQGEHCSLTGQYSKIANKEPDIPGEGCYAYNLGHYKFYRYLDMNSDGIPDLVTALHYDARYYDPSLPPAASQPPPPSGVGPGCPVLEDTCVDQAVTCTSSGCVYDHWKLQDCIEGAAVVLPCFEVAADPDVEPLYALNDNNGPKPEGLGTPVGLPVPPSSGCIPERTPEGASGSYKWTIYWGLGDGTFDVEFNHETVVWQPIPLASHSGDMGPSSTPFSVASQTHAIIDLDGDGHLDAVHINGPVTSPWWWYYRGDGTGNFHGQNGAPYLWSVPVGARPRSQSAVEQQTIVESIETSSLIDVNGDGRPDLVRKWPGQPIEVFYNIGTGFTQTGYPLILPGTTPLSRAEIDRSILDGTPQDHRTTLRSVDVDGDGRPDFQLDSDVYWNMTAGLSDQPTTGVTKLHEKNHVTATDWSTMETAVDLNGDGITDVLKRLDTSSFPQVVTELNNGHRRAVMKTIDNHRGMTVEIKYTSHNDKARVVEMGNGRLPRPTWVVSSLTRTDAHNDPGGLERWTYKYIEPVWKPDQDGKYGFRGFTRVDTTSPSGARTVETFDYTLDWSGRGTGTTVYPDPTKPNESHTISTTSWQARPLFDTDAYPDTLTTFHTSETSQRTCGAHQTTAQCQATGALLRTTTVWEPKSASGVEVLQAAARTTRSSNTSDQVGDRRTNNTHQLYYSGDTYRVRTIDETREEMVTSSGGWAMFGRTEHVFDSSGRVEVFTTVWHDSSTWGSTFRDFDMTTGNLTVRIKPQQYADAGPDANKEEYKYDPEYELFVTETKNERGHVVETDYDLATGARTSTRGPNVKASVKEEVRFVIDALGRPIEKWVTVDGANPADPYVEKLVERTSYLDFTSPQRVETEQRIDFDGSVWVTSKKEFDGHGRLKQVTTVTGGGLPYAINEYDYDVSGNIMRFRTPDPTNDAGQVEYKYGYDNLGRPLSFRDPQGNGANVEWNGLIQITRECENDGAGGCVAGGQTAAEKTLVKDVFGRLTRVRELTSTGTGETLYEYSANDQMKRITNADGYVTDMTHDWTGKRLSITRFERTWSYTYDLNGNLLTELMPRPPSTPALDYTKTFAYDDLDRRTSIITPPAGLTSAQMYELAVGMVANTYDYGANGIGRLGGITHPNNTLASVFAYDGRGNKVFEAVGFSLEVLGQPGISDLRIIKHRYNALGQVTVTWHADTDGAGAEPTHTTVSYDARGLPMTVDWNLSGGGATTLATYTRNVAGSIMTRTSPNSDRTYLYDQLGRVTSDKAVDSSGAVQFWHTLVYGKTGEVESMVSKVANTTDRSFTFTHDRQHQLVTASASPGKGTDYTAAFTYSPAGRVLSANVAVPSTARAALNRNVNYNYTLSPDQEAPDRLTDPSSGAARATYTYDHRGNAIKREVPFDDPVGRVRLDHDGNNDVRVARGKSSQPKEIYYYGAPGRRMLAVRRTSSTGPIDRIRLWLGETEIWYTGTGALDKTWAHVNLGSPIARIENRTTVEFSHHSMLGHLIVALDENGAAKASFQYGPFGEVLQKWGDTANHLRQFNGKEADTISQLSYYGYRYYDPLSLSWTQSDPLYRFAPDIAWDEPRRMTLYAFLLNNPLRYFDPDGRDVVRAAVAAPVPPHVKVVLVVGACAATAGCRRAAVQATAAAGAAAAEAASELIDKVGDLFGRRTHEYPLPQPLAPPSPSEKSRDRTKSKDIVRGPGGARKHTPGRGHNRKSQRQKKNRQQKKAEQKRSDKQKAKEEAQRRWDSMSEEARKMRPELDPTKMKF